VPGLTVVPNRGRRNAELPQSILIRKRHLNARDDVPSRYQQILIEFTRSPGVSVFDEAV